MATLVRSVASPRGEPIDRRHRDRQLRVAVVVLVAITAALGAALLVERAGSDGSTAVPAAVDETLDRLLTAMEVGDHAQLQTVVTPGFRRTFYQADADGSPWRDVWRLERYEFWDDPMAPTVDWEIERGDRPIVRGTGPWYVSEPQTWRNAAAGIQYEGIATFVLVESRESIRIDDMYWAAEPRLLRPEALEHGISDELRSDFVAWLVGRFVSAGLDPPDASVTWLPPSLDCPASASFARHADLASGRRHSVTFCFDDPALLLGGEVDGRWSTSASRNGLHEFAHVWMYTHVGGETRAAFVERAGLDTWRGDRVWGELGVEHAAETIAWGVAGSDAARYEVEPVPSCEELTARFELLTGRPPFTSCG